MARFKIDYKDVIDTLPHPGQPAVRDDAEIFWVMDKSAGLLHCVGDNKKGSGYPCHSIEEASEVLHTNGHIV
jgi:hypothetical protein